MGWVTLFSEHNVISFMLLLARLSSIFLLVPIFSHNAIPANIKAMMALFFTIIFYPQLPPLGFEVNITSVVIALLSEILFGIVVGIVLQLAFHIITYAGEIISFMMGFSMASAIDPQTGVSSPIMSQFLSLLAIMILLATDLHHWIILFCSHSLLSVPLGSLVLSSNYFQYIIHATSNMFLFGFMVAFPITALGLLSDVIFGMIMKTMPQFNLLVIGYPIKIALSLGVIIAALSAIFLVLKAQISEAFSHLGLFF